MKYILLFICALCLINCKGTTGEETAPENRLLPPDEVTQPTPEQPIAEDPVVEPEQPIEEPEPPIVEQGENIALTYYAITRVHTPFNQFIFQTSTMTGYCTDYEGRIFCWDDGQHVVSFRSNNINYLATNNFWQISGNGTCLNSCNGIGMQIPREIVDPRPPYNAIYIYSPLKPEDVFNQGTSAVMACEKFTDKIVCGSLEFTL